MPYQGRDVRVVAIRDLTWRKAMEEEKARIQQENLTFSMETLGFVTHELKSPLAAMQTMIAVMLEGFAGEVPDKIGHIFSASGETVKNCRIWSRITWISHGSVWANWLPVKHLSITIRRLWSLVLNTLRYFLSRANHSDCRLSRKSDSSGRSRFTPHCVDQLPQQCRQIWCNTHASSSHCPGRTGHISTTVWNEGAGFRPEEQALLFTKFSRLTE